MLVIVDGLEITLYVPFAIVNETQHRVIRHLQNIAQRSCETAGNIAAKRELVDDYFSAHPTILKTAADSKPVSIQHITGEWITSNNHHPDRRLLYIHGGSWMAGRVEKYRPHIGRLAEYTACAILAIDYRLAPEEPFPAGLDDCVTAFEWMCNNGPEGESPAAAVFIAGDSAGGNLTLASLLKLKDKKSRLPDGAITMSAPTDLSWSSNSISACAHVDVALNADLMPLITNLYLQNREDRKDAYISPLYGELSALPPMLLQAGEAEILLDDTRRFAAKARSVGVDVTVEIYPDMPHVFQGFAPYLPEAIHALESIRQFIQSK